MLTATFPASLTITGQSFSSQSDTGIDQAVYVPSGNYIAGVRGGYVLKFNPATGAYLASARFCSPNFGDCAICYDTVHDRLICSFWNEQSANGESHDARGLYKINPVTLAVELFRSSAAFGTAIPEAIHNLNFADIAPPPPYSANGQLWATTPALRSIDPATFFPGLNDPGPLAAGPYYPIWTDLARDLGTDEVFLVDPLNQLVVKDGNYAGYSWPTSSTPWSFPVYSPANVDAYGICVPTSPPGSSYLGNVIFISTRDGPIYWFAPSTRGFGVGWAPVNLPVSPVPLVYHLRYNPVNKKIYAPDVAGNRVFVITPGISIIADPDNPGNFMIAVAPALTATYGGFDSPIDVVFSPTGVWAVQQGLTGLKFVESN